MNAGTVLNIVGLTLSTVAAILMYWFPPSIIQFTDRGERQVQWTGPETLEGKKHYARQRCWSRVSVLLLALGFFLQLLAALLPVFCSK